MYLCTDRAVISVKDSDRSGPGAPGAVSVCKCPYICSMFRAVVTSRVGGRRYRPHPDGSRSCWSGLRASAPRPRLTKLVCDCVTRTASAARYKHGSQRQVNVMRASCVKRLQRVVRELCRASRRSQAAGHGFTTDRGAGPATNTPLVLASWHGSGLSTAAGSRTMATRRNRLGTLVACDATGQVVTYREHGSAISVSAGLRTAYGDLTWSPGHWRPARHLDRRGP